MDEAKAMQNIDEMIDLWEKKDTRNTINLLNSQLTYAHSKNLLYLCYNLGTLQIHKGLTL